MRTTVTLDPDVQALLKKAMHSRELPFKQVLNDAVRAALAPRAAPRGAAKPFKFKTYDLGRPLIDLTKANALAGELEDLEIIAKMNAGQ